MPDSSTGAHLNNLKNGFPELLTNKTIKYFWITINTSLK
jgi:hypothetical protein